MNAMLGMDRYQKEVKQVSTNKKLNKGLVSLRYSGVRGDVYQWAPLHVCPYIFRSFLDMEHKSFILILKLKFFCDNLSFKPF